MEPGSAGPGVCWRPCSSHILIRICTCFPLTSPEKRAHPPWWTILALRHSTLFLPISFAITDDQTRAGVTSGVGMPTSVASANDIKEKWHYQAAKGMKEKTTALREAYEEVGLKPSHVKIVKVLEPFLSKHPMVELRPHAGEVDAIFDVPLEMFLKNERHRVKDLEWKNVQFRVHYFEYDAPGGKKYTIWGIIASVLIHAASIILQRKPHFPDFFLSCN